MSLIELLTGSVVFTAAAGSSLQLWALAGAAAVAEQLLADGEGRKPCAPPRLPVASPSAAVIRRGTPRGPPGPSLLDRTTPSTPTAPMGCRRGC